MSDDGRQWLKIDPKVRQEAQGLERLELVTDDPGYSVQAVDHFSGYELCT